MKDQNLLYKIYTLSCPITKAIRYVGVTKKQLNDRLSGHIYDAKKLIASKDKINWISEVERPFIELLDFSESKDEAFFLEKYWVSQFKQWGFNLINKTEGGKGSNGFKHTIDTKNRISQLNKLRHPIKDKKPVMTKDQIELLRIKNVKVEIGQYDLNGNFVQSFESIKEGASHVNGLTSNLTNVADKGRIAYGFFWVRKKSKEFPLKIKVNTVTGNRVIVKFTDFNNGQEKIFESINDAVKNTGIKRIVVESLLRNESKYENLGITFTKIDPSKSIYTRR